MNVAYDTLLAGRRIDAVVIGASAGGIDTLLRILPALPRSFGFSVTIVLHLPDDRDSRLSSVFQQHLPMPVRQADDKMTVQAGTVYFAPPGYHLSIERDMTFSLSQEDPVHFSRPAIDIMMESAADAYGKRLAGMLLTGASADGAAGMARIAACGGLTVVQDPKDAEIATMPSAAIRLHAPDAVLPVPAIRALMTAMMEIQ